MALTRIHVGLSPAQIRILDRLAEKLGLDRTNTIRYCLSRTSEAEGLRHAGGPPRKAVHTSTVQH